MFTEEFNKSRAFLEKMLEKNPDNQGFLDAYVKLIEAKSKFDIEMNKAIIEKEIRHSELNCDLLKTQNTNNANVYMNQNTSLADVSKTFISNYHQIQQNYHNQALGLMNRDLLR